MPGYKPPSQDVRPTLQQFANSKDTTIRTAGSNFKALQEYCDALGSDIQTFLQNQSSGSTPASANIGVAQKATFWIGLGANQVPSMAVTGWAAAFTFEESPFIWNTAIFKYALIYAEVPPTSADFVMDLRLDGTSIFNSSKLKLPSGTAAYTAVVATNFATPSDAIIEKTSMILADVISSGPEVVGVCAILLFDLAVT